jgi:2-polyprenyl-3-methyl-5-hydroxy-6-metoxy-1,4-benzoquinol methylase
MTADGPEACPVCGSARTRGLFRLPDGRREHRCRACGALWFFPLPTEAEQKAFYDEQWREAGTDYEEHYRDPEQEAHNLETNFLPRLRLLAERGFSGRILDVGCAGGTFLKAAREHGWEACGTDLGEEACTRAAAAAGCEVRCGTLAECGWPDGFFDVIHASQVIEHVLDPGAFLAEARRLLRPGGALLVATPLVDPRVFRTTYWIQRHLVPLVSRGRERPFPWAVHHPFHVILHSAGSLALLLDRGGFEILNQKKLPWMNFIGMNAKWRAFYHVMNTLFCLLRSGMNIDVLARKR